MVSDHTSINRSGFTLVELIVVLAIITLIIGMLFPAVQRVRGLADDVNCASNLRQIGVAIQTYAEGHGYYPAAARVPSEMPGQPSLVQVLSDYTEKNVRVFRCPSDSEYFGREGLSYEFLGSYLGGKKYEGFDFIRLLSDFSDFHGPAGSRKSRNVLFGDGHVE